MDSVNQVKNVHIVRVRKTCRGEKILAIPKEIASEIKSEYMIIQLDDSGHLTYTPIRACMKKVCLEAVSSSIRTGELSITPHAEVYNGPLSLL
jgi:hypothetical protein